MRSVLIPLLVLLFFMCGAQTQSTQTEVQTESRNNGADIYDELRELRDMVVEMRVLLTVTQNELQKTLDENVAQNTELTAVKARLAAIETEVGNLRKETAVQIADLSSVTERLAATETDMEHVKKDTAVQNTDLTTMKTEVMNLRMASAAQETRLSASESEVENLMMETAAQEAELTAVKTRLAATETDVVNLEKVITEKPKVAFSAGLTNSGYVIAGDNHELNLVFTKIITNVGQAYSSTTGFFTAPVRGVYYFRFTVMDQLSSRTMWIRMYRDGQQILYFGEGDTDENYTYLSGGVTLQLEVGDVVNLRIPAGRRLYDSTANHCTFSGFLLFPL